MTKRRKKSQQMKFQSKLRNLDSDFYFPIEVCCSQIDGESIERLEKYNKAIKTTPRLNSRIANDDVESEELQEIEEHTRIISKDKYQKRQPEEWAAEMASKTRTIELKKKEKQSKITLGEILRLKAEVEEVTQTLRMGEESRRLEEERGAQLKSDIQKKLEQKEKSDIHFEKVRAEDDYLKSLRSAYEESSSDEEKQLELRIRARQKPLVLGKYKPKTHYPDELSEIVSRPNRQGKPRVLHEEDNNSIWTSSYNPKTVKLDKKKDVEWYDTSEEEHGTNPFFSKPKASGTKTQSQKAVANGERKNSSGINIAGLTEEELILINQMVEERINNTSQISKHTGASMKQPSKRRVPQYDDGLLSLVYDLDV